MPIGFIEIDGIKWYFLTDAKGQEIPGTRTLFPPLWPAPVAAGELDRPAISVPTKVPSPPAAAVPKKDRPAISVPTKIPSTPAAGPDKRLPRSVETRDWGAIYDGAKNAWRSGYQSVFRDNPDSAIINIFGSGSHVIIPGKEKSSIRIITIAFTVGQLTDPDTGVSINLYDGDVAISGPMDFADENEPRGIVIPFPYTPLGLGVGNAFSISNSVDVRVAGMVCYFYQ